MLRPVWRKIAQNVIPSAARNLLFIYCQRGFTKLRNLNDKVMPDFLPRGMFLQFRQPARSPAGQERQQAQFPLLWTFVWIQKRFQVALMLGEQPGFLILRAARFAAQLIDVIFDSLPREFTCPLSLL